MANNVTVAFIETGSNLIRPQTNDEKHFGELTVTAGNVFAGGTTSSPVLGAIPYDVLTSTGKWYFNSIDSKPMTIRIKPIAGKQITTLKYDYKTYTTGKVMANPKNVALSAPITNATPFSFDLHFNGTTGDTIYFAVVIEDEKVVTPPATQETKIVFENYTDYATNHFKAFATINGVKTYMVGDTLTVPYAPANGSANSTIAGGFEFDPNYTFTAKNKKANQTFYNDSWLGSKEDSYPYNFVSSVDTSWQVTATPKTVVPVPTGKPTQKLHGKIDDISAIDTIVIQEASDGKSGTYFGQFIGTADSLVDIATQKNIEVGSQTIKIVAKPKAGYEILQVNTWRGPTGVPNMIEVPDAYPITENDQTEGAITRNYSDATGKLWEPDITEEIYFSFVTQKVTTVPADKTVDVTLVKATADSKYGVIVKADGVIAQNTANVFHVPQSAKAVTFEFEADNGFTITNINIADVDDQTHGTPITGVTFPQEKVLLTYTPAQITDKAFVVTCTKKAISGGSGNIVTSTGVTGFNGYRLVKDERGITTLLNDIYQDGSGIDWSLIIQSVINYPIRFPDEVYGSEVHIVGNNGLSNSTGLNVLVSNFEIVMSNWLILEKYANVYNYQGAECYLKLPFTAPYMLDLELVTNRELKVTLVIYLGSTTANYNIYVDDSLVDTIEFQLGKEYELFRSTDNTVNNQGDTGAILNGVHKPYVEIQRQIPIVDPLGYECNREGVLSLEDGYIEANHLIPDGTIQSNHLQEIQLLLANGVYI